MIPQRAAPPQLGGSPCGLARELQQFKPVRCSTGPLSRGPVPWRLTRGLQPRAFNHRHKHGAPLPGVLPLEQQRNPWAAAAAAPGAVWSAAATVAAAAAAAAASVAAQQQQQRLAVVARAAPPRGGSGDAAAAGGGGAGSGYYAAQQHASPSTSSYGYGLFSSDGSPSHSFDDSADGYHHNGNGSNGTNGNGNGNGRAPAVAAAAAGRNGAAAAAALTAGPPSAKQLLAHQLAASLAAEPLEPSLGSLEDYSAFDTIDESSLLGAGGAPGVLHGKQAAGAATFEVLRVDAGGHVRRVHARRRDLLREHKLQPRDLRRVDPSVDVAKTQPSIAVKENVLLVNLGGVRAIVTADKALFFEPSGVQTRRLLDIVIPRLQASASERLAARGGNGGGSNGGGAYRNGSGGAGGGGSGSGSAAAGLGSSSNGANGGGAGIGSGERSPPFELEVLEGVLMVTTGRLERQMAAVSARVHALMTKLPGDINPVNLEELRRIKQDLVQLENKADSLRGLLEEIMDDEDELREVNLSSRPRREERRKQRERDRANRQLSRAKEEMEERRREESGEPQQQLVVAAGGGGGGGGGSSGGALAQMQQQTAAQAARRQRMAQLYTKFGERILDNGGGGSLDRGGSGLSSDRGSPSAGLASGRASDALAGSNGNGASASGMGGPSSAAAAAGTGLRSRDYGDDAERDDAEYLDAQDALDELADQEEEEAELEEVEDLLEYYLQRVSGTQSEAERQLEGARDLEESIGVSLSARRYEVNRLELMLSMGSFAAALGAMIAGIFGMNMKSTLEFSVLGFWGTTGCIVVGCAYVFVAIMRYTQRRKIL